MTRSYAIIGSDLAPPVINVLVALVLIVSLTPEVDQAQYNSAPLYRLSPIPAGADWGRS
jgi:hypothetical protein